VLTFLISCEIIERENGKAVEPLLRYVNPENTGYARGH